LLGPWQDELIEWWAAAGLLSRIRRSEKLSKTGRRAEQLSFEYESDRTGYPAERIYLDTNFAGFDVLSRLSKLDATPLPIEVKGSERRPKEADFVLTRNEFRAARGSSEYLVHLWHVGDIPQLFVVPFAEVNKHLPIDQGDGRWETARLPFAPFLQFREL
jgi:hypothetical protein